jgi:hypothetical protein
VISRMNAEEDEKKIRPNALGGDRQFTAPPHASVARPWLSHREALVNSASSTLADLADKAPETAERRLPIAEDRPIRDKVITARGRRSAAARVLRLTSPPPSGRSTAVICLLAALCAGGAVLLTDRGAGLSFAVGSQTTDDAYVRADQITISSHVAGHGYRRADLHGDAAVRRRYRENPSSRYEIGRSSRERQPG